MTKSTTNKNLKNNNNNLKNNNKLNFKSTQKKKKQKAELIYDPAIPLLSIYPEKNMIRKDTCTSVFILACFTLA